ncbi:MAG: hypothetical protein V4808_12760 [Pseudomonadota bacterium]
MDPSQRFADMVRQPGHALNPAWQALSGEIISDEKPRTHDVRYLLRLVRRRYSPLEALFEESQVRRWGQRGPSAIWIVVAVLLVILILVASAVFLVDRTNHGLSVPPARATLPVSALTNQRVDTDRALEAMFGARMSIADIEDRNPALGQELQKVWVEARGSGLGNDLFAASLASRIDYQLRVAIRTAPDPVVLEYYRLTLASAKDIRDNDATDCAIFATGGQQDFRMIPVLTAGRRGEIAVQLLLNPSLATPDRQAAPLPAPIAQTAAARASLDAQTFAGAMRGTGTFPNQCAAHIATWETLLELPPAEAAAHLRTI